VGSAAQKAQLVSNLIKQFSIDIPMLDNLLSGQKVDPEEDKLSRMLDARLKPVTQFLSEIQGAKQQRTESLTASAQETLAEFTQKAEFLADVKEDVADRLEMAARRGQVMTLQEAYDWACKAHPEISKVIASRASLRTPGATPDAASASVAGSPNVGATAVDPKNLRAVIEKSWG
jgi:phytoene/squalene synthetase